jgi:tetratricopeptide (TPR) repeat protein
MAADVLHGRFELGPLAGKGATGTVHRATDLRTGAAVAVKLFRVERGRSPYRFHREAAVLASLRHENVASYVAHGVEQDRCYLAMEWVEGETLSARIARSPLPVEEALYVVLGVARALAAAHRLGIVHRDVKPANVMLSGPAPAPVKLVDFGIVRLTGEETLTTPGWVLGTPGYMAPEQARADADVGAPADVFSLGVLLYRALSGKAPFAASTPLGSMTRTLLEEPEPIAVLAPDARGAVAELVDRMLRKEPGDRPRDGDEVVLRLEAVLAERTRPRMENTPTSTRAASGISRAERRVLSVLLVAHRSAASARTTSTLPAIAALAARVDARVEVLADGTIAMLLPSSDTAPDQARQAASCALELRAAGISPIALASGRAQAGDGVPMGPVIERAAAMLAAPPPEQGLRVDEETRALLRDAYRFSSDATGLALIGPAPPTHRRASAPFVGRHPELTHLRALLEQAAGESVARAVVVTGQAGSGKSRLLAELLEAPVPGFAVLHVRGESVRAAAPYHGAAQVVRAVAGVPEQTPVPKQRLAIQTLVREHFPADERSRMASFLCELAGVRVPDEEDPMLAAVRRDPASMSDQLRRAFVDLLAWHSHTQPTLLVFEDMHWGDRPTIEAIGEALGRGAETPLVVIGLVRSDDAAAFASPWPQRHVQHLPLGALSRSGAARLVSAMLDVHGVSASVDAIVERAAGNPLFLEELALMAAESPSAELPLTVLGTAQARIDRLDPNVRRVLRGASAFGERFCTGGVAHVLGAPRHAVEHGLDLLRQGGIVAPTGGAGLRGEQEYAFRHAILREAAHAMLTETDRVTAHRLAGDWLARAGEPSAAVLAEHFRLGNEPERAVAAYASAAAQALDAGDLPGAIDLAERGVACGASGSSLGALRLAQAHAHRWRGETKELGERAAEAVATLVPGSAPWLDALVLLAVAGARGHDAERIFAAARMLVRRAADATVDRDDLGRAAARIVGSAFVYVDEPDLFDELERIASRARPAAEIEAWLAVGRSHVAMRKERLGDYRRHLAESRRAFAALGDDRSEIMATVNHGLALGLLGRYADAEAELEGALARAERAGLLIVAAGALLYLGDVRRRLGRVRAAQEILLRAQAPLEKGSRVFAWGLSLLTARLHTSVGRHDEAAAILREMRPSVAAIPQLASAVLAELIELALARGAQEVELRPLLLEAHELRRRIGAEIVLWSTSARGLEAIGEHEQARAVAREGVEQVLARAANIDELELRASFLRNVEEHRCLIELDARWTPG